MKCGNNSPKKMTILPFAAASFLGFLFVRGVAIAQNLDPLPPRYGSVDGDAGPLDVIAVASSAATTSAAMSHPDDPKRGAAGSSSLVDVLKRTGNMDAPEEALEGLHELRPVVLEKKGRPQPPPPPIHRAIPSTGTKISTLQWGIPQHPTLVEIASSTHGQHPRHGSKFDVAQHRRRQQDRDWGQIGNILRGARTYDYMGESVSISADGMRVATGSRGYDGGDQLQTQAGHVRMFEDDGSSTWNQLGPDIEGDAGSRTGLFVSISGDGQRVAISAYNKVLMFEYDSNSWTQLGNNITGGADSFGQSISMSKDGQRVAIGDSFGTDNSGYVGVYGYSETNGWELLGSSIVGLVGDRSGVSVSLSASGNRVAIGAYGGAPGDGSPQSYGRARVYEYGSGAWGQLGSDILGEAPDDNSGFRVSLSDDGDRVAVSAPWNDAGGDRSGHVRVYQYNTNSGWVRLGDDIDGEATNERIGIGLSLSGDGSIVAIGAPYFGPGHVRIFEYNGSTWSQLGTQINGDAAGDQNGYSVALSSDGLRVAIGADYHDPSGLQNAGSVRVFELPPLLAIFDLALELDSLVISLDDSTDFSRAIVFQYNYTGNTPGEDARVSFAYDILEDDCTTEFANFSDTSKALYFNAFNTSVEDKLIVELGINLTTIEDTPVIWTQGSGETEATMTFCGVLKIFVDSDLFQFHESNVTASINLKEDGGFTLDGLNVGLDRKDANAVDEAVEVEFPVDVFHCNNAGVRSDPAPTQFTQGDAITLCFKLETDTDNVFVAGVQTLVYSATQVTQNITLIDGGVLQFGATATFDCSSVADVCIVKFIAAAAMYVDTVGNFLFIEGSAVIAFGADTTSRRQLAKFNGHQSGGAMRRMQEEDGGGQLVPFEFTAGMLQPEEGLVSVGARYGILISVVVGCAVIVLAAVAFFVYRRNRTKRAAAITEKPGLNQDTAEESSFSSLRAGRTLHLEETLGLDHNEADERSSAQPTGQSHSSETKECDRYEVVEV